MDNILKMKKIDCKILRHFYSTKSRNTKSEVKYPKIRDNVKSMGEYNKKMGEISMGKIKNRHPYYELHPWKTKTQFAESMIKQIIYNQDGLVAVNKPYGISARPAPLDKKRKHRFPTGIINEVHYTVEDVVPEISKELGYESLTIIKSPERFTTGVLLLSANEKITKGVEMSMRRAEGKIIPRKYWIVTRRMPIHNFGERRVAMKLIPNLDRTGKVVDIVTSWSENERERQDIKILNVQFNVLSTASDNLASLTEIKTSTTRWHAVRLFAATQLLSPVLGDRVLGSRSQNVMGKFMNINPLTQAAHEPPKLDPELLKRLKLMPKDCTIIPAHVHLREFFIPWFLRKGNDITITAPPQREFLWTCKKLEFKKELYETPLDSTTVALDEKSVDDEAIVDKAKYTAVT